MKKSIILTVLAVVAIAGCVQGQIPFISTTTTMIAGAGLTITEFSVEPEAVYGGSTGRLIMEVENMGGASVADGDGMVMLIGSALDLTGDDTMYWTSSTETIYKGFGKDMNPADPVREVPADTKRFTWSLTAPDIDVGQIRDDIFIARTYYDYDTKVSGTVWVYSQQESDAARAAGRPLNPSTFSSTSGPVAVTVKISPDPVVLYAGEDTFALTIKLSSVGGGTLYETGAVDYSGTVGGEEITEAELNKVNVDVVAPDFTVPGDCEGVQELVAGKDVTVFCDVTVDSPPTTFKGYPITVIADYGYFTERTASVSVSGR